MAGKMVGSLYCFSKYPATSSYPVHEPDQDENGVRLTYGQDVQSSLSTFDTVQKNIRVLVDDE